MYTEKEFISLELSITTMVVFVSTLFAFLYKLTEERTVHINMYIFVRELLKTA